MDALLNPTDRTRGAIKWGLVAYTAAMFSFVTIFTAIGLDIVSISFIDNRDFPGVINVLDPGPLGYRFLVYSKALSVVPNAMFLLNNWLADGFMVGPVFNSATQEVHDMRCSSFIVAMSFLQ